MADQGLKNFVATLNVAQLLYVRREIDQALHSSGHIDITDQTYANQASFDLDRSTFCSSTPTLYQSGRSTPHASSISSENTAAFETSSFYAPGVQHPDIVPSYIGLSDAKSLDPTYPALGRRHVLQTSLRQRTLRGNSDESYRHTQAAPTPAAQSNGQIKRLYFCTFCAEDGNEKFIKTKQDWKRHEQDFHFGTGLEWRCRGEGCTGVFFRGDDCKKHFEKDHAGQKFGRESKNVIEQGRVYACGFEPCRELNYNWRARCDHVATCLQKGQSEWSYSRTIKNLLKMQPVSGPWKLVYTHLGAQHGILPSQLQWDPKTTRHLREQLETLNFESDLETFLKKLFWAGNPNPTANTIMGPPLPPPNHPLPPTPTRTLSNAHSITTSFIGPRNAANIDPSLVQSNAPLGAMEHMENASQPYLCGYRNSIAMSDVPIALPEVNSLPHNDGEATPVAERELISWQDFLFNSPNYSTSTTPPVAQPESGDNDSSIPESKRSCSRRTFIRKSKEWLKPKKSQQFQQTGTIDHPDVPLNTRMPSSSPRKVASANPPSPFTDGFYSIQS